MIDFLGDASVLGWGTPPHEFMEFAYLPRNGWPKSEQDRLSLADRRVLFDVFSLEARYTKREPHAKPD